jgi:Tol biopolymer transport system component
MGEVYRATDTKLKRDVAIKVLPEHFAEKPERLARFQREAQLLASLNHPSIAAIYGLDESGENRFLVLELVEGETLAERLTRGPMPLDETLDVSRQIAEGLETAHEKGVIHRDLKPANVMITPEGKVKILDFGLAKAFEHPPSASDLSHSPTVTGGMTRDGVILGTAAYMSPEQARGKPVDKRSDVWAFGVVVWEMLTASRLFARQTVTDTLAAVLTIPPDWAELPSKTPRSLQRMLRRCLQRDAAQRLRDIADARLEIEEAASELEGATIATDGAPVGPGIVHSMRKNWWVLAPVLGIGMIAAWMAGNYFADPGETPRRAVRLDLGMPQDVSIDARWLRPGLAISPDGRWLVFVALEEGTQKLFKRSLESFEITPMPGTENARFAFFSPDGRWVGFWDNAEDKIKKVELAGGVPVVLCDSPNTWGADWGTNGKIVFYPGDLTGLWQVPEAGGEPVQLLAPSPETPNASYLFPEFLPGGKAVLYTAWRGGFTAASAQIKLLDLESGKTKVLLGDAAAARYLPTGHLVFGRGGRAEIAPFDLESREITGPSVPIPEPIFYDPGGKLHLTVSETGTLAFIPGGGAPRRHLVYMDREGNKEIAAGSPRGYEYPRVSPDGRRLSVTISEYGEPAIWIVDRSTGLETKLAGSGRRSLSLWSPDGQRVAFAIETKDPPDSWSLYWQEVNGSDPPEPLVIARQAGDLMWPDSWTPDGKSLIFGRWSTGASHDIYLVSLENPEELQPLLTSEAHERKGLLSPDGRWLAYASDETGRFAIYVQRFPGGGDRHQISADDTAELVGWAPDGRKIYYVKDDRMMEVEITTAPRFQLDGPRALFDLTFYGGGWFSPELDLSADGEQFVMVEQDHKWGKSTEIKVILDWFEELKDLAPARR